MTWTNPLPLRLVPSADSYGFLDMEPGTTGIPHGEDHPGAFAHRRRFHVHEGVDLYCPEGTPVSAVEDGVVVAVIEFTGTKAEPPSPHWCDTQAIMVEGASGVVAYGEVGVGTGIRVGVRVGAGETIGHVRRVLIKEKTPPRPMAMLHLELHEKGTRDCYEWPIDGPRPPSLLDPTPFLLGIVDSTR